MHNTVRTRLQGTAIRSQVAGERDAAKVPASQEMAVTKNSLLFSKEAAYNLWGDP